MTLGLRHEGRLDGAVDVGQFCDGEYVEIRTMMGTTVSEGTVLSTTPFGLIVRNSAGETRFFKEDLYLFTSPRVPSSVVVSNELMDQSIDARVQRRLAAMGEAGDDKSKDSAAKQMEPSDKEGDGEGDKEGKEKDDSKGEKKGKKEVEAPKDDEAAVDVDNLPPDIKNAISSTNELDDSKVNSVMGEISSAAVKAMKRVDIDETEIFGKVEKIQDAVYKILTGKSPDSSKSPKKKAKK